MPRNVLLLQGPVGPFFRKLATQLESNGHNVLKVNLNGGDSFFYRDGDYENFTGAAVASSVLRRKFPEYEHHRTLRVFSEGLRWIRSGIRKTWYKVSERAISQRLIRGEEKYFLVPLQVHNDTQVTQHSDYGGVEEFIERVIISFASAAPDVSLVFKHHPYDRGYKTYRTQIQRLAERHNVTGRVHYVHDTDLPSLLQNARGSVLINSTVGISSLYHQTPVVAMGNAIYDFPGLTHQGSLESFWQNPGEVNKELFLKFRQYLIKNTQINGSVYTDIQGSAGACGMIWSTEMFKTHIQATHHNIIDLDEHRVEEVPVLEAEKHNKLAV